MSPERWHEKNHGRYPFEGCFRCQRARAICRSKRSYGSREDAEHAVTEINHQEGFARPVTRYICRWCERWHLTTASTPVRVKRAERARRKWLRDQLAAPREGNPSEAL